MPFLTTPSYLTRIFLFSLIIILLFLLFQRILITKYFPRLLLFITFIALAFLLLYRWRRTLTQSYLEKLRLEEREELLQRVADKNAEIEKLRMDNDHLGRLIHKDNKLIPAMEYAVYNYLHVIDEIIDTVNMDHNTTLSLASHKPNTISASRLKHLQADGKSLLAQLQQIASERESVLNTFQKALYQQPLIGIPTIDALLQLMEKRAIDVHIHYQIKLDQNLKDQLLTHIDEADALHLLSDLIENAIIATTYSTKKELLIHIGFSYENLFFDIYDSGIPFSIETYQHFGNQPYTTYADSGGSGIGLTDIWSLKRKYKSSLQIYEYPPDSNIYIKKIRFLFDRKNHFLIQTYRSKEIRLGIIRKDLHVFPHNGHSFPEINEKSVII